MRTQTQNRLVIPVILVLGLLAIVIFGGARDIEDEYINRCERLGNEWSYWNTGSEGPRCQNKETGQYIPISEVN